MGAYRSPGPGTSQMPAYGTSQMPAYGTSQMPAYGTSQMSAYGNQTLLGWSAPPPPPVPVYPSSTASFATSPIGTRPLRVYRRRRSPRWGFRFLLLAGAFGALVYYARPYVPWVDQQVVAVETGLRAWTAQYGLRWPFDPPAMTGASAEVASAEVKPAMPEVVQLPAGDEKPKGAAPTPVVAAARPKNPAAAEGTPRARSSRAAERRRPLRNTRQVALVPAKAKARASDGWKTVDDDGFPPLEDAPMSKPAPASRAPASRSMAAAAQTTDDDGFPPLEDLAPAKAAKPSRRTAAAANDEGFPPLDDAGPAAAPAPAAGASKTKKLVREAASSGDELDRLMAGALDSVGTPKKSASSSLDRKLAQVDQEQPTGPAASALPLNKGASAAPLKTGQIKSVMGTVQGQMNECYRQHRKRGRADVKVEVSPGGRVSGTLIRGEFAGTPTGACIESKLKQAVFPASSGLRFDYLLTVR